MQILKERTKWLKAVDYKTQYRIEIMSKNRHICSIKPINVQLKWTNDIPVDVCTKNKQTMFVWRKSSGINIDVWINLDGSDSKSTSLEYSANTAGYDSFSHATDYSTSHQNVLHLLHLPHCQSTIKWHSSHCTCRLNCRKSCSTETMRVWGVGSRGKDLLNLNCI